MFAARWFRLWRNRVRSAFAKERADDSLSREIAFHIEQLTAEYMAQGLSRRLAREAALRDFGNVPLLTEECRDQRRMGWLHDLRQDVVYGWRQLRANPRFTVVAVASLALAIGANTAMLSALQAAFLGALPFPDADRLVLLRGVSPQKPNDATNVTVPEFLAWKERTRSYSSVALTIANRQDLTGFGPPERLTGQAVTPSLFRTLAILPQLGRTFSEEEGRFDAPARVIVLSHGLWQRLYGGARDVLGRTMHMNGTAYTVIGVMPQGFWYPRPETEYYVPVGLTLAQQQQSARLWGVVARLRHGVSMEQAQAELGVVSTHLAHEFPDRQRDWRARLVSLRRYWFGWLRGPMSMLESAGALVLLIACTNVATLLLARATVRRPEFAMRIALGASRARLLRQLLTESLLLSGLSGVLGLAIAWVCTRAFQLVQAPPAGISIEQLPLSGAVLAITAALSLLCGLAFGAAPALFEWRGGPKLRGALVVAQVSLASILLISAGLLLKSFYNQATEDRGFDPQGLLTFELTLPRDEVQRLHRHLAAIPDVESAAAVSAHPTTALVASTVTVLVDGRPVPVTLDERDALSAVHIIATPGYLDTVRAHIVRGRDLDANVDYASAPWSAVINETLARRLWPGEDPIGQRVTFGGRSRAVVGIVRNMTQLLGGMEPRGVVYTSYDQHPTNVLFGQTTFVLRGPDDPLALVAAARHAAAEIDPVKPIANLVGLQHWAGLSVVNRGFYTLILSSFAFVATLLACMGVYGVTAYTVSQRTREIGIRLALGARFTQIGGLLCGRAAWLIATGVVLGTAGAFAVTRYLDFQLHRVSPRDPWIFAAAIGLLALVALVASFAPARRARAINPAEVLKQE